MFNPLDYEFLTYDCNDDLVIRYWTKEGKLSILSNTMTGLNTPTQLKYINSTLTEYEKYGVKKQFKSHNFIFNNEDRIIITKFLYDAFKCVEYNLNK